MNYDQLTEQEKRMIMPFASEYLAEELAKKEYRNKRIKKHALARVKIENGYEEGEIE